MGKFLNEYTQNELSNEHDSRASETEEYQQKLKEKEEIIAELTEKLQAQEVKTKQFRGKAKPQPTQPTDELDEAVMEEANLREKLTDAKDEKQKAYSHMLEAKQWKEIEQVKYIMSGMHLYMCMVIIMPMTTSFT